MSENSLKIYIDGDVSSKLSSDVKEKLEQFKKANPDAKVLVLGPTGEVGREVVSLLLATGAFSRVTIAARKKLDPEYISEGGGKDSSPSSESMRPVLEQVVPINYDDEKAVNDLFAGDGYDTVFCCLGTTRGISGKDGFYRVDHDYVMKAAEKAKAGGTRVFSLCSAANANSDSMFFYAKVKGQVETELKGMGLPKVSIFQPGFLECERDQGRIGEKLVSFALPLAKFFFPKSLAVSTRSVARAMVYDSLLKRPETPVVNSYSNSAIIDIANSFQKQV
ncbi:Oxidoreductase HTATIP2 [Smittium mucronatum]|uniref:Oxidoreductase HTATIP2 n=1 Tax=Smittium mucronatum TaxID=133383 RepID=A0A1R0H2R6_9FUNG|nr:Oxidoreductase HTATIP2 [Smittium mucronatum]